MRVRRTAEFTRAQTWPKATHFLQTGRSIRRIGQHASSSRAVTHWPGTVRTADCSIDASPGLRRTQLPLAQGLTSGPWQEPVDYTGGPGGNQPVPARIGRAEEQGSVSVRGEHGQTAIQMPAAPALPPGLPTRDTLRSSIVKIGNGRNKAQKAQNGTGRFPWDRSLPSVITEFIT
jgi:hypothetical protein